MILKCIRYIMRKNLLLLKDLLEHQTKIFKYMTLASKNVYIDKLNDIVGEYNKTYHRAIKMKPVDVKLYVKQKAYDNLFNSWVNKKDLV